MDYVIFEDDTDIWKKILDFTFYVLSEACTAEALSTGTNKVCASFFGCEPRV